MMKIQDHTSERRGIERRGNGAHCYPLLVASVWTVSMWSVSASAAPEASRPLEEQQTFKVEVVKVSDANSSFPWWPVSGAAAAALITGGFGFGMQRRTLKDAKVNRALSQQLADGSAALTTRLAEHRQQCEALAATLQFRRDEALELVRYRRSRRAERLLPLFAALPSRDDPHDPKTVRKAMTGAYMKGAGLFLGEAAPIYHWATTMLDTLAGASGGDVKSAVHRVASTLRTALIDVVDGNDDPNWSERAALTLQRVGRTSPSFADMCQWKGDPRRVLRYLILADSVMGSSNGAWPSEG